MRSLSVIPLSAAVGAMLLLPAGLLVGGTPLTRIHAKGVPAGRPLPAGDAPAFLLASVQPIKAPEAWRAIYHAVEHCAGMVGDYDQIRWAVMNAPLQGPKAPRMDSIWAVGSSSCARIPRISGMKCCTTSSRLQAGNRAPFDLASTIPSRTCIRCPCLDCAPVGGDQVCEPLIQRTTIRYAAVATGVLALIVGACRSTGQTRGSETIASPPAGTATAAPPTSNTSAPPPVVQAEALAEDVQNDVAQGAWPAAETRLRELRSLGERLGSVGVPQPKQVAYGRAVDSLAAAMTRRSRSDALTAGNHVSRIVTETIADYPSKVPVAVAYMDVAGRDVLYAAEQGRWSDASDHLAELARNYAAVQAKVRMRDSTLDRRVTSEIAQLRRAVAARARDRATSLAQALLEDVDRIEQTF